MYCTNCGSQVPDDVKFCTFCGAAIDRSQIQPSQPPQPTPPPQPYQPAPVTPTRPKSSGGAILAIIVVVIIGFVILYFGVELIAIPYFFTSGLTLLIVSAIIILCIACSICGRSGRRRRGTYVGGGDCSGCDCCDGDCSGCDCDCDC